MVITLFALLQDVHMNYVVSMHNDHGLVMPKS